MPFNDVRRVKIELCN